MACLFGKITNQLFTQQSFNCVTMRSCFFPPKFQDSLNFWSPSPLTLNIAILWSIQLPADKFVFGNRWGAVVAHLVAHPEAKHGCGKAMEIMENPFGT